ncbi:MAG: hypothetical protein VX633_13785 [Verrucomicrobiota bacterium]|nr:hypothetical protein [Verrucomicrobiota bacterium]
MRPRWKKLEALDVLEPFAVPCRIEATDTAAMATVDAAAALVSEKGLLVHEAVILQPREPAGLNRLKSPARDTELPGDFTKPLQYQ